MRPSQMATTRMAQMRTTTQQQQRQQMRLHRFGQQMTHLEQKQMTNMMTTTRTQLWNLIVNYSYWTRTKLTGASEATACLSWLSRTMPKHAKWVNQISNALHVVSENFLSIFICIKVMWTDKTYRLILNTKIFDKMQIDRANKKSIRFNAFDNGTIRIFLIKVKYLKLFLSFHSWINRIFIWSFDFRLQIKTIAMRCSICSSIVSI